MKDKPWHLKIILAEGNQKAIHYHDLISPMNYDGALKLPLLQVEWQSLLPEKTGGSF
jgi:hypothetical protein